MNIFKKKVKSQKHALDRNRGSKVKSECEQDRLLTWRFKSLTSSGFTLVETLVAIAILMIAIAGPLTVAEKGLSAAIYARNQLMASYLAQDGLEYIKNIVDTNELNIAGNLSPDTGDYWITDHNGANNQDLSTSCFYPNSCYVDTIDVSNDITQSPCQSANTTGCSPLDITPYGYVQNGTGQVSPFTRYFYLQPLNINGGIGNAMNVVVKVTWPGDVAGGGGVTLEDTMFDTPSR